MRITDEMVEAVTQRLFLDRGSVDQWGRPADGDDPMSWTRPIQHRVDTLRGRVRDALEAALPDRPQGFCTKTQNCRFADGHNGGCERS